MSESEPFRYLDLLTETSEAASHEGIGANTAANRILDGQRARRIAPPDALNKYIVVGPWSHWERAVCGTLTDDHACYRHQPWAAFDPYARARRALAGAA